MPREKAAGGRDVNREVGNPELSAAASLMDQGLGDNSERIRASDHLPVESFALQDGVRVGLAELEGRGLDMDY